MATWRPAKSITILFREVNAYAPNRRKTYDGTIGDAAHAAHDSAHNPNNNGDVCAGDLTHSPATGFDAHRWAREEVKDPHPALCYIISNGQVARWSNGWKWVAYKGPNPHKTHAHVRVGRGNDGEPTNAALYNSTQPWNVAKKMGPPKETEAQFITRAFLKPHNSLMTGEQVVALRDTYKIPVLATLTITGAETSMGDPDLGGATAENFNFGNIRATTNRTTPWASLAVKPDVKTTTGTWLRFRNSWDGMTALGRLLKVGPPMQPGFYLARLQARDWRGFAEVYYGKEIGGFEEYVDGLVRLAEAIKKKANAAGWSW